MYDNLLSTEIANYIQDRRKTRLEKIDKAADKARQKVADDIAALAELELELRQRRNDELARFKPSNWLTDAANCAKQITRVTHALKFTHTDAKGNSIYYQSPGTSEEDKHLCLSTVSLSSPQVDVVGNAAALDVASLLQLSDGNTSLISWVAQGDTAALQPFANDGTQLKEWMTGFKQALADKELSSHKLAKQLYFPVAEGTYHIISPLYASSLSQALYQRIADTRFSDESKALRKSKKDEQYADGPTVEYRNVAVQTFGGTKPQNVSQLNSRRGGKSFLLSCQPPQWSQRQLPPINHKRAFWREYDRRAWRTARSLKEYLIKIADKTSTLARRDRRADYVDELIDILLQYAAEVQGMREHAGWSAESSVSLPEQLWLDPFRDDADFPAQRAAKDWQREIAHQFANWLNHKLKDKQLLLKDVEYREWSSLLEDKLVLLRDDLKVMSS